MQSSSQNAAAFGFSMVVFGVLTTVYFVHSRVEYLIEQTFIIHWRSWLNEHMVADWLDGRAYHRGHFVTIPVPARLAVFFPSLVFGWLRAKTGGIGAPLAFHAFCNVFSEILGRAYGVY